MEGIQGKVLSVYLGKESHFSGNAVRDLENAASQKFFAAHKGNLVDLVYSSGIVSLSDSQEHCFL